MSMLIIIYQHLEKIHTYWKRCALSFDLFLFEWIETLLIKNYFKMWISTICEVVYNYKMWIFLNMSKIIYILLYLIKPHVRSMLIKGLEFSSRLCGLPIWLNILALLQTRRGYLFNYKKNGPDLIDITLKRVSLSQCKQLWMK